MALQHFTELLSPSRRSNTVSAKSATSMLKVSRTLRHMWLTSSRWNAPYSLCFCTTHTDSVFLLYHGHGMKEGFGQGHEGGGGGL